MADPATAAIALADGPLGSRAERTSRDARSLMDGNDAAVVEHASLTRGPAAAGRLPSDDEVAGDAPEAGAATALATTTATAVGGAAAVAHGLADPLPETRGSDDLLAAALVTASAPVALGASGALPPVAWSANGPVTTWSGGVTFGDAANGASAVSVTSLAAEQTVAPEPSSLVLMVGGLLLLVSGRRKQHS